MFKLDEFVKLAALPGVWHVDFHQCRWSGETTKPTRVLYFGVDLSELELRCNHPPQWWDYWTPRWEKKWTFAPHPPLAGRVRDNGDFATKAAAAYPAPMNKACADKIATRTDTATPSQTGGGPGPPNRQG